VRMNNMNAQVNKLSESVSANLNKANDPAKTGKPTFDEGRVYGIEKVLVEISDKGEKLWVTLHKTWDGVTLAEVEADMAELKTRMSARGYNMQSVGSTISNYLRFKAAGIEIPARWTDALAKLNERNEDGSSVVPTRSNRGRKPRQPEAKSEAAGTVAVDATTGQVKDEAGNIVATTEPDPLETLFEDCKVVIRQCVEAGFTGAEIVGALADLRDSRSAATAELEEAEAQTDINEQEQLRKTA
jgi:hypothetical protein